MKNKQFNKFPANFSPPTFCIQFFKLEFPPQLSFSLIKALEGIFFCAQDITVNSWKIAGVEKLFYEGLEN